VKAARINFAELLDDNRRSWISTTVPGKSLIDELEAPKYTRRHLLVAFGPLNLPAAEENLVSARGTGRCYWLWLL
jgi:hypothetical protein